MPLERIDKVLSSQNIGSRKEIKELAKKGFIKINGVVERSYDAKVNPEQDEIVVCGEVIRFRRYMYIMMNKPAGVVSACNDPKTKTVVDLVPKELYRRGLFPAGRLDKDTEGLMIITDDGDFAHRMLSPKKCVYKIYEAIIDGEVGEKEILEFKNGIQFIDGTICLPAELYIINKGETFKVRVKICEGKFHQVKKMFMAVGREVLYLKRIKIGSLELDKGLKLGECREMEEEELIDIFI